MADIYLRRGREKSLLRHHPWIFSGAIAKILGDPVVGQPANVLTDKGEFVAIAAYNPNSTIAGRVWSWKENEQVTSSLINERINTAVDIRRKLIRNINSDSMRLVYAETDGLPGLILDQYGEVFVLQFSSAAVEFWRNEIIDIIIQKFHPKALYERSDIDVRDLEGLPQVSQLLYGNFENSQIVIHENDLRFHVDILSGHKTGFYLDQRDNRLFARSLTNGLRVLDCFSYTGGFALNGLIGGAVEMTLVDSSSSALKQAQQNLFLNNLDNGKVIFIDQDIFKYLRLLRDKGEMFDMIILDPPKFAPTASQAERASRAYKDINLLSFKLLNPGGYLLTFSCSGGVDEDLFQKIVAASAADAGVDAIILKRLHQAPDHPVALNFPEGAYLKGFLVQKVS